MEAEGRVTVEYMVSSHGHVKLGSLLAELGRQVELTDQEFALFEQVRDKTPAWQASFAVHCVHSTLRPGQAAGLAITDPWQS